MILVDSSVWIDLLRGKSTVAADHLASRIGHEEIGIGDLILTEVLQGLSTDREFRMSRQALERFSPIQIAGHAIALQAAINYRFLRARGVTIRKTIDTLIATRCIVEDWPLLYSDRDFDPFVAHLGLRAALA